MGKKKLSIRDGEKIRIRVEKIPLRDEHPKSLYRELSQGFGFWLQQFNSSMRIRDRFDPGSGMEKFLSSINIPDPQHCRNVNKKSEHPFGRNI